MRKSFIVLTGMVVAMVVAGAIYLVTRPGPDYLSPAMMNVQGADIGGPFELTMHTGERITSAKLIDRPTLVYFGYTYCPDICPIDTLMMADAVQLLDGKGIDVRPVFITIDPERDTPEALAFYADALHPKMVALTGSEEDIRAAAKAYKVFYSRQNMPGSAAGYLMSHSGFMYLVTPDHGLAAIFRNGFPAEQIANDVEEVLKRL